MFNDEHVFENYLEALDRESRCCAVFVATWLALRYLSVHDHEVRDQTGAQETFWHAVAGGLQAASVSALDRLYDESGVGRIPQILRFAERHKSLFSPARLEARKRAEGLDELSAHGHADGAYLLSPDGFDCLFHELDQQRHFQMGVAQPLRDGVIAAAGRLAPTQCGLLFGSENLRALEQLAVFGLRVQRALSKLYYDGCEPVLETPPTIEEVLASRVIPGEDLWEHCRAARSVADLFESLQSSAPGERPAVAAAAALRVTSLASFRKVD
jgi:hypothetical protein